MGVAREKVRVARALENLPKVSTAMESRKLSYSKAREITVRKVRRESGCEEIDVMTQEFPMAAYQLAQLKIAAMKVPLVSNDGADVRPTFPAPDPDLALRAGVRVHGVPFAGGGDSRILRHPLPGSGKEFTSCFMRTTGTERLTGLHYPGNVIP